MIFFNLAETTRLERPSPCLRPIDLKGKQKSNRTPFQAVHVEIYGPRPQEEQAAVDNRTLQPQPYQSCGSMIVFSHKRPLGLELYNYRYSYASDKTTHPHDRDLRKLNP